MGKMSKIEAEIRQLYDEENFSDIIRNEGFREVENGFEKRVKEIRKEIKDVDLRMANKVWHLVCGILFIFQLTGIKTPAFRRPLQVF